MGLDVVVCCKKGWKKVRPESCLIYQRVKNKNSSYDRCTDHLEKNYSNLDGVIYLYLSILGAELKIGQNFVDKETIPIAFRSLAL